MAGTLWSSGVSLLIVFLLTVCTGQVGWAQDIDFSKPYARMGVVTMGAGVAAAGCVTTPASSGGDLLNSGFESGESVTWTQSGTGALTTNATYPAGWTAPTNGCTNLARSNTTTATGCSYVDLGENKAEVYVKFYMYVDSITIDDWNNNTVVSMLTSTDPAYATQGQTFTVGKPSGSSLTMRTTEPNATATTALSADTEYLIELHFKNDNGGASSGYRVNGGSWNTAQSNYTAVRYIHFGRCLGTNGNLDIYFDIIRVDDDGTYDTTP